MFHRGEGLVAIAEFALSAVNVLRVTDRDTVSGIGIRCRRAGMSFRLFFYYRINPDRFS